MTVPPIPNNTLYMFSCSQCPAHQSVGTFPKGVTIQEVADPSGVFHSYLLIVGLQRLHVDHGHYGYSPDLGIFPLNKDEEKTYFGEHVCQKPASTEKKTGTVAQESIPKKHTRKKGVTAVAVTDSSGHLRLQSQPHKFDSM